MKGWRTWNHKKVIAHKRMPSVINGSKAHAAVQYAIRMGRLKRQPCSVCRKKQSYAHHKDYKKPLIVVWLCASHHLRLHLKMKLQHKKKKK